MTADADRAHVLQVALTAALHHWHNVICVPEADSLAGFQPPFLRPGGQTLQTAPMFELQKFGAAVQPMICSRLMAQFPPANPGPENRFELWDGSNEPRPLAPHLLQYRNGHPQRYAVLRCLLLDQRRTKYLQHARYILKHLNHRVSLVTSVRLKVEQNQLITGID
jgi:hypothetical protein